MGGDAGPPAEQRRRQSRSYMVLHEECTHPEQVENARLAVLGPRGSLCTPVPVAATPVGLTDLSHGHGNRTPRRQGAWLGWADFDHGPDGGWVVVTALE